ncbi:MAG: hypothetical protein WCO84_01840 [bacterium]
MTYFDNINFFNIEYIFNLVYKAVFNLPDYITYVFYFWNDMIGGFGGFKLQVVLWTLTVLISYILFYSIYKIVELKQKENEKYLALFNQPEQKKEDKKVNKEWKEITAHMDSENSSGWVLAIIEADKILDRLLIEKGYDGTNIGERLKAIPEGKLKTLQSAWEAHKIRNKIAHEAGYVLERREARVAISNYEEVFKESGYLN